MSKKMISNLLLLLTALIWGSAFVAQKAGAVLEPLTYSAVRTLISAVALVPVVLVLRRARKPEEAPASEAAAAYRRNTIVGGIVVGVVYSVASGLQQFGIFFDTDAGKAGFITALYIVIVPILGIFIGKKTRLLVWVCVVLGAIGFYLLTMAGKGGGFTLEKGDFFVLLCSVAFSVHILTIDHYSPKADGVALSCIQFFVAGTIFLIGMLLFEKPVLSEILACWFPIIYAGVLSGAVAYTLQIVAQKNADPAQASLILSLESVFAALSGALLMHERMTGIELAGCAVIFAAVILAQLPSKEERLSAK